MFKTHAREQSRLERRVAKIATADLSAWADQALYGLGRDLSQWQRSGDSARLSDAEEAAEALLAVIREVRSRT